jgi:hypothetical protein
MSIPIEEEFELLWKELGSLEESAQRQLDLKDQKILVLEARLAALEKLVLSLATGRPNLPRQRPA